VSIERPDACAVVIRLCARCYRRVKFPVQDAARAPRTTLPRGSESELLELRVLSRSLSRFRASSLSARAICFRVAWSVTNLSLGLSSCPGDDFPLVGDAPTTEHAADVPRAARV
jgi:hypothetical protein